MIQAVIIAAGKSTRTYHLTIKKPKPLLKVANKKDVFVKAVISSNTKKDDIIKARDIVKKVNSDTSFVLQPNSFDMSNGVVKKCEEYQGYLKEYLTDIRIIPQIHKVLKVR